MYIGCLDEYFRMGSDKENQEADGSAYIQACKSVLNSKSNDEALVIHQTQIKDFNF